jgi:hypothetical protein
MSQTSNLKGKVGAESNPKQSSVLNSFAQKLANKSPVKEKAEVSSHQSTSFGGQFNSTSHDSI